MAKGGSFFRSGGAGRLILVVLVVLGVPAAGALALIHSVTQPPVGSLRQDPSDLLLPAEEVTFPSADGVALSGWFVMGRRGAPAVILCHDLGGSRLSLLNPAIGLNKAGHPLLMFDFRRHGGSGAARSTLGINERLDVLGAIAYLRTRGDVEADRFGGWGVGMGAYALALGAAEAKGVVALALDSLYPDVPAQVDRLVRARVPPLLGRVVPAAHFLYNIYFGCRLDRFAVSRRLADLSGRHVLLIAGADTPDRNAEERAIYDALPEGPEGGKNLLELKASGVSGLYAGNRKEYDARIVEFFSTYLSPEASVRNRGGSELKVVPR